MALTQADLDRILGTRPTAQGIFNANQPTIKNTPRSTVSGTWADILKPIVSNPIGEFVGAADMQRALDSASYGKPLTTGGSVQTGGFRPEYLAAALGLTPMGKGKKVANVASPRMSAAESEALGYWHPVGNEKKLKIPVSEMTSVVTEPSIMTIPKIITPEDLYGGIGISTKGDRSNVGLLHEINGVKLDEPVPLEGGFRYMDVQDPYNSVWASAKGHVTQYANKAKPIIAQDKDAYLISTLAGHGATDFNAMMTDSLFKQMKNLKISNKAKKEFDDIMKERRPEWAGLNNPDAINQLNNNGELRHTFHDVVELDKFQKAGFPDIASTRKAVTDPNLLDVPNAYSGYRIGKIDPNNIILPNPVNPHTTYDTAMGGNLVGTSGVQLPVKYWFPDFFANRRLENKPISGDAYSLERKKPTQEFNQQWLDQIMPVYEKALKEGLL
jgi:hypothetical protein